MLIVDSSVWIDGLRGRATPQVARLVEIGGHEPLGVSDLIIHEVLRGVRGGRRFQEVRSMLLEYQVFLMGGAELAVKAAQNYRELRRRGITVRGPVDCLIATFCIETGHQLLHNDRDFDQFEQHLGLQVVR